MSTGGRIGQNSWSFKIHAPSASSPATVSKTSVSNAKGTVTPSAPRIMPTKIEHTPQTQECIPLSKIAPSMRSLFSFEFFNRMQSSCLPALYEGNDNCVIGAPTAAGKTVCFELALANQFQKKSLGTFQKILYLAPLKSLVQERLRDWKHKLGPLGISCQELSGDMEDEILMQNDMYLATPEKWDAITRKWKEHANTLENISLILVDEVHLLGDDRGAVLESIITRTLIMASSRPPRIVALSASSPNVIDIGQWIGAPEQCIFYFGEDHRPITPQLHVIGYPPGKNDYLFERALDFKLWGVIAQYSEKKPTLVFCSSRKSTAASASKLLELCSQNGRSYVTYPAQKERLFEAAKKIVDDPQLAACILNGIAYHHAGMSVENRSLVERLFVTGEDVMVVVATSTLAVGVNMPAYLVVIKSTSYWTQAKGVEEYSPLAMRQMIGRAGRPQFGDSKAVAVIMTQQAKTSTYESILECDAAITESKLHKHLCDTLLTEIAVGSITSIKSAFTYLKRSFLAVRIQVNPSHYVPTNPGATSTDNTLLSKSSTNSTISPAIPPNNGFHPLLRSLAIASLGLLTKFECVTIENQGLFISPLGRAMSRHFVSFQAIQEFFQIFPPSGTSENGNIDYTSVDAITTRSILECISSSPQFSDVIVRRAEKKELKEISSKSRFSITKGIQRKEKIMILLQSPFGQPFSEQSLNVEAESCLKTGISLCTCLLQFFLDRGWFYAAHKALLLLKSFRKSVWSNADYGPQTPQIPLITRDMANLLQNQGYKTLLELTSADAKTIQLLLSKPLPFAQNILARLNQVPSFSLSVKFEATPTPTLHFEAHPSQGLKADHRWLLLGHHGKVIAYRLLSMSSQYQESLIFDQIVPNGLDPNDDIEIVLASDDWIGFDIVGSISMKSYGYQHLSPQVEFQDPYSDQTSKKRKRAPSSFVSAAPSSKEPHTSATTREAHAGRAQQPCEHKCKNKFLCKHDCCKLHPDIRASGRTQLSLPSTNSPTSKPIAPLSSPSTDRASNRLPLPSVLEEDEEDEDIRLFAPPASKLKVSEESKIPNRLPTNEIQKPALMPRKRALGPLPRISVDQIPAIPPNHEVIAKGGIVVSRPSGKRILAPQHSVIPVQPTSNMSVMENRAELVREPIKEQMSQSALTPSYKPPSLIPGSKPVAQFLQERSQVAQPGPQGNRGVPPSSTSMPAYPSQSTTINHHALSNTSIRSLTRATMLGGTNQPMNQAKVESSAKRPLLPQRATIPMAKTNSARTVAAPTPQKTSVNGWNALLNWELQSEP